MGFRFLCGVFALVFLCVSCGGAGLVVETPHSEKGFDNVLGSIVGLVEPSENGLKGPYCTGFFISETDFITAGHCILESTLKIELTPQGPRVALAFAEPETAIGTTVYFVEKHQFDSWIGSSVEGDPSHPEYYSATVLAVLSPFDDNDIALLRINQDTPPSEHWLEIRDWTVDPPQVGEVAYAVGLPVSEPWILTRGIVSRIHLGRDNLVQLFHDARIGHGSSGGPVMDSLARVTGINVQLSRENIFSKATPSSVIQTLYNIYETRLEIEELDSTDDLS